MAPRVHPQFQASLSTSSYSSSSSSSCITSKREVFTIWMKSLVMNSNGCTVFDSNGEIIYRIDNYHKKCSNKAYLMDLKGNVLSTILKKRLRMFGRWEGYSGSYCSKEDQVKPWFQVRKPFRVPNKVHYNVCVSMGSSNDSLYTIERLDGKLGCKILDQAGNVVAEMKPKQSRFGVGLGDDVLTLTVESNVDESLIFGLIVVHGLIHHKL
ncbi:hypothetical protein MKW98_015078 [Papaver atlanticum]|uniref:Uncharacterized protein n=1 Tax=Papaver atlanticum TaxID=357466 RepID=A0AAD4XAE1_9MAGN|nr:hypothetical protein MKW98_015078 [Papaver atlanticum]